MDNVVIDTNCLIMAISSRSGYHKVWLSFLAGDYTLCISNEILEKYAEVIARNISINAARYVVYATMERKNVRQITPSSKQTAVGKQQRVFIKKQKLSPIIRIYNIIMCTFARILREARFFYTFRCFLF